MVILQTIKTLVKEKGLSCIINTHYANHAFYFDDKVLMVAKTQACHFWKCTRDYDGREYDGILQY